MKKLLTTIVYCFSAFGVLYGQSKADINLHVKHSVNGVSEFDRSKFLVLHAGINDNDWDSDVQRKEFLEGYDVYLGRNNGGIVWEYNLLKEDPNKKGWPSLEDMDSRGQKSIANYANKTNSHALENRLGNMIIGGQPGFMYPGVPTNPNKCCSDATPWVYEGHEALAEFYAQYIKKYFGNGGGTGQNTPKYLEVLNEPFVHAAEINTTKLDITKLHNVVAKRVKELNPSVQVGGFTAAHPMFEAADFGHWNSNWKMFIDNAGENMDFFSFHLYDFRPTFDADETQRKGSNIEAIMDMIDHYSVIKLGERKPFVVSEYGYFLREQTLYSPVNDWHQVRSFNAMMLQLMERQDQVASAIPFMILKALWGTKDGIPYGPRLLIQEKELPNGTGDNWIYSQMIQYFDLWKAVKGTRVDTYSIDPDLLLDAYVDGNKAYVILNNLIQEEKNIDLSLFKNADTKVSSVSMKYSYANEKLEPQLEEKKLSNDVTDLVMAPESTIILTYTFENEVTINETSNEAKYFADTYLQPIKEGETITFQLNGIEKGQYGEAVLRVGLGRDHGMSLRPVLKVNGKEVYFPTNWKGYDQKNRDRFFGVIDVAVPFDILKDQNTVELTFPDAGGHVTSMGLQVFNFSTPIQRREQILKVGNVSVTNHIGIYPNPSVGKFTIKGIASGMSEVELYNITGALLYQQTIQSNNGSATLDASHLEKGQYILRLKGNVTVDSAWLVIE